MATKKDKNIAQPAKMEQTRAGQQRLPNESNAGQRALIAAYQEATRDQELPETQAKDWNAWVELGRKTCVDGTFIFKRRRSWKG